MHDTIPALDHGLRGHSSWVQWPPAAHASGLVVHVQCIWDGSGQLTLKPCINPDLYRWLATRGCAWASCAWLMRAWPSVQLPCLCRCAFLLSSCACYRQLWLMVLHCQPLPYSRPLLNLPCTMGALEVQQTALHQRRPHACLHPHAPTPCAMVCRHDVSSAWYIPP